MTSLRSSKQLLSLKSLQCSEFDCGNFDVDLEQDFVKILGLEWKDVIKRTLLHNQDKVGHFQEFLASKCNNSISTLEDSSLQYTEISEELEFSEIAETPKNAEALKSIDAEVPDFAVLVEEIENPVNSNYAEKTESGNLAERSGFSGAPKVFDSAILFPDQVHRFTYYNETEFNQTSLREVDIHETTNINDTGIQMNQTHEIDYYETDNLEMDSHILTATTHDDSGKNDVHELDNYELESNDEASAMGTSDNVDVDIHAEDNNETDKHGSHEMTIHAADNHESGTDMHETVAPEMENHDEDMHEIGDLEMETHIMDAHEMESPENDNMDTHDLVSSTTTTPIQHVNFHEMTESIDESPEESKSPETESPSKNQVILEEIETSSTLSMSSKVATTTTSVPLLPVEDYYDYAYDGSLHAQCAQKY